MTISLRASASRRHISCTKLSKQPPTSQSPKSMSHTSSRHNNHPFHPILLSMFYSLPLKRLEGGLCGGEEGITRHSFQPPRPTLVSNSARHQLPRCLNFQRRRSPRRALASPHFLVFPHKHFAAPKGYAGLAEKSTHTHT
jgi:hypothetical protein